MTYEEVKAIRQNPKSEDCDNEELAIMIDVAIEKQIPKKPNYRLGFYHCANCNSKVVIHLTDGGVVKISASTGMPNKFNNSPEHCFIWNDSVEGVKCPQKLDKQFYINIAKGRLNDFGI